MLTLAAINKLQPQKYVYYITLLTWRSADARGFMNDKLINVNLFAICNNLVWPQLGSASKGERRNVWWYALTFLTLALIATSKFGRSIAGRRYACAVLHLMPFQMLPCTLLNPSHITTHYNHYDDTFLLLLTYIILLLTCLLTYFNHVFVIGQTKMVNGDSRTYGNELFQ